MVNGKKPIVASRLFRGGSLSFVHVLHINWPHPLAAGPSASPGSRSARPRAAGSPARVRNHASRYAADYYRRAIALDPQDYRNNVALGTLAFNQADWVLAEQCARAALLRAHRLNKNRQNRDT